ncbi:hypothetical protein SCUP515_00950 [Seiridium cupressi]
MAAESASSLVPRANSFQPPWTPGTTKDYSDNKNYNIGEEVQMSWTSSVSNASMTLCQDNFPGDGRGGPCMVGRTNMSGSGWDWTVSYGGLDPDYHNVCYLSLDDVDDSAFTSHYFNISDAPATTSSSSISSTASSTSTSTPQTSASASTTAAGPTTTVTQVATGGGNIGAGTVAGIAVGVVAGFLLLLGALWWAWNTKKRRSATTSAQAQATGGGGSQYYATDAAGVGGQHYYAVDGKMYYQEAGGGPVHEAPGSQGQQAWEAGGNEVRRPPGQMYDPY